MRKRIAISLLILFLGANTDLTQLLKMPVLIHHYLEHRADDASQSFADFLKLHYSNHLNHGDTKHHDHTKLPYKTSDYATAHSLMAFEAPVSFMVPNPPIYHVKLVPGYNGFMYSFAIVSTIWQPPKHA